MIRHALTIAGAAFALTGCSSGPKPEGAARPEESWVATTCSPAAPDTTGWKLYRFSDLELMLPPDFTVGRVTTRSIAFSKAGAFLSLEVSTSPTRELFYAAGRPLKAREEEGCQSSLGGYPGVIMGVARANQFSVHAEWDGAPLWGANDWRKRLIARMNTRFLQDAHRLRDALHTLRVSEKR